MQRTALPFLLLPLLLLPPAHAEELAPFSAASLLRWDTQIAFWDGQQLLAGERGGSGGSLGEGFESFDHGNCEVHRSGNGDIRGDCALPHRRDLKKEYMLVKANFSGGCAWSGANHSNQSGGIRFASFISFNCNEFGSTASWTGNPKPLASIQADGSGSLRNNYQGKAAMKFRAASGKLDFAATAFRSFLGFDVSGLPENAEKVKLEFFVNALENDFGNPDGSIELHLVEDGAINRLGTEAYDAPAKKIASLETIEPGWQSFDVTKHLPREGIAWFVLKNSVEDFDGDSAYVAIENTFTNKQPRLRYSLKLPPGVLPDWLSGLKIWLDKVGDDGVCVVDEPTVALHLEADNPDDIEFALSCDLLHWTPFNAFTPVFEGFDLSNPANGCSPDDGDKLIFAKFRNANGDPYDEPFLAAEARLERVAAEPETQPVALASTGPRPPTPEDPEAEPGPPTLFPLVAPSPTAATDAERELISFFAAEDGTGTASFDALECQLIFPNSLNLANTLTVSVLSPERVLLFPALLSLAGNQLALSTNDCTGFPETFLVQLPEPDNRLLAFAGHAFVGAVKPENFSPTALASLHFPDDPADAVAANAPFIVLASMVTAGGLLYVQRKSNPFRRQPRLSLQKAGAGRETVQGTNSDVKARKIGF